MQEAGHTVSGTLDIANKEYSSPQRFNLSELEQFGVTKTIFYKIKGNDGKASLSEISDYAIKCLGKGGRWGAVYSRILSNIGELLGSDKQVKKKKKPLTKNPAPANIPAVTHVEKEPARKTGIPLKSNDIKYLSLEQAASQLHISQKVLKELVATGQIMIDNNYYNGKVPENSVAEYAIQKKQNPTNYISDIVNDERQVEVLTNLGVYRLSDLKNIRLDNLKGNNYFGKERLAEFVKIVHNHGAVFMNEENTDENFD